MSRDTDRPVPFLPGGGGNCWFDVMLVALEGMTMEPGRLWYPETGRADDGLLLGGGGGGGGGGGCGKVFAESCGDEVLLVLMDCEMFGFWPGE